MSEGERGREGEEGKLMAVSASNSLTSHVGQRLDNTFSLTLYWFCGFRLAKPHPTKLPWEEGGSRRCSIGRGGEGEGDTLGRGGGAKLTTRVLLRMKTNGVVTKRFSVARNEDERRMRLALPYLAHLRRGRKRNRKRRRRLGVEGVR